MFDIYYIKPALTDQAGQCRIYRKTFDSRPSSVPRDYEAHPMSWKEVGLMASNGSLRCLSAPMAVVSEMTDSQPLMAGIHFVYETEGVKA